MPRRTSDREKSWRNRIGHVAGAIGDAAPRAPRSRSRARRALRGELDRVSGLRRRRPLRHLELRLAAGARGGLGPLLHRARRRRVRRRRRPPALGAIRCRAAVGRGTGARRVGHRRPRGSARLGRRPARGRDAGRRVARLPVVALEYGVAGRGRLDALARGTRRRPVAGLCLRHVGREPRGATGYRHHERHRPLRPMRLRRARRTLA
jgi:hypothetical protein